ncbi:MAG: hypothetical protein J6W09_10115 [Bacteroidales bacterium]|nr:hypothetical protein [Bacteroidales bacterium]
MRQWANIKPDSGTPFAKIMLYPCAEGTYVFLYDSPDAVFCTADEFYPEENEALETWGDEIDAEGWHFIDDPLPGCQHDAILPIRVKGRDKGEPQWGRFEILKDGEWYDFSD